MIHHAFARLGRAKGVFALIVLILGSVLGAAICAAVFAYLVVMRPLPYPEQSRLAVARQLIVDQAGVALSSDFSYPALDWTYQSSKEMVRHTAQLSKTDIGTRLAFGARPRNILLLVLRTHSAALAAGFALAAVVLIVSLPQVGQHMPALGPLDATLAMMTLGLLAALACLLSARPLLRQPPAALLGDSSR